MLRPKRSNASLARAIFAFCLVAVGLILLRQGFAPPAAPPPLQTQAPTLSISQQPPAISLQRVYLTIDEPNGRLCNQLLTFSTALERIKRRPEAILVLDHKWAYLQHVLDMDVLHAWLGDASKLEFRAGEIPLTIKRTMAWWDRVCAERVVRSSIIHAIQPHEQIKARARNNIAAIRLLGAKSVLSVHVRNMEGTCEHRTRNPHQFGSHCHWTSTRYQGKIDQCAMDPLAKEFLVELQSEFPELAAAKVKNEEIGLYLSSDNGNARVDQRFQQAFAHRIVESTSFIGDHRSPEAMLTDMWTSTLADVYLGNTMSSCEGIVAQWRSKFGRPFAQYPKSCFDGFVHNATADPLCGPGAKWDDYL